MAAPTNYSFQGDAPGAFGAFDVAQRYLLYPVGEMQDDDLVPVREVWPPGTLIKGDFTIERKLGEGGFGTAYIARQRYLDTVHVIKRLHEQYASNTEYVRKFFNEGRQIRRLKGCPNIVEVEHMTQSEDGFLILVMEYVPGGDLAGVMKKRRIEVAEAIEFGRQIANGLAAAHHAGLIHRDIKPENVLMSADGSGKPLLKLIDFGIAADHQDVNQATSVARFGSIGFAAPEQWMVAGKSLDGRTDLYALGATLYKMLSGRMPFQEVGGDIGAWIEAVRQGPPPEVKQFRPDCPQELSDLVQELLAARPEGRPSSAVFVEARLRALLAPSPTTAIASGPAAVIGPTPTAPLRKQVRHEGTEEMRAEETHQPETVGVGSRQSKRIGVILAGGMALAAVAAAWIAMQPGPAPTPIGKDPVVGVTKPEPPKATPAEPATKEDDKQKVVPQTAPPPVRPTPAKKQSEVGTPKKGKNAEPIAERRPDPPPPTVDHLAMGDTALNAGDYRTALQHYRQTGNQERLARLQRAIEGDTEDRATALMDRGQYAEALRVADGWLREFAGSQRLQRLRTRVERARASQ